MRRAHGSEIGVIECWYTSADKLPETKTEKEKIGYTDCDYDRLKGIKRRITGL